MNLSVLLLTIRFFVLAGLAVLIFAPLVAPRLVFATAAPTTVNCDDIQFIGCETTPFAHGSQCCGAGGCPELGSRNPGPWAGYSWEEYKCTFAFEPECVTFTITKSYQCYSGDVCAAGSPQGDSFVEAGTCNDSSYPVVCGTGGSYKQGCTGTYATGSPRPEKCGDLIPNRGGDQYGFYDVGSSSACGTSANGGYIVCSGDPAYGTCKAGAQPPPPPSDICARPTFLPPPNTVSCAGKQPCPSGDSFGLSCTKTCTDSLGVTCSVPGTSFWACQGGTQWYNDGTCWPNNPCPTFCVTPVCTPGTSQTSCQPNACVL